jgi:hypothetical protein
MNKNILIRGLTDEDNIILEHIRNLLGVNTNSKAVLKMIRDYVSVKSDMETVIAEYVEMRKKYLEMGDTLNTIQVALGMKYTMLCRKKIVIENGKRRI